MTEVFVVVTTHLFQGPKRHRASMIRIINTRISALKTKMMKNTSTHARTHMHTLSNTHARTHTPARTHALLFSVTDTNTCMTLTLHKVKVKRCPGSWTSPV